MGPGLFSPEDAKLGTFELPKSTLQWGRAYSARKTTGFL